MSKEKLNSLGLAPKENMHRDNLQGLSIISLSLIISFLFFSLFQCMPSVNSYYFPYRLYTREKPFKQYKNYNVVTFYLSE